MNPEILPHSDAVPEYKNFAAKHPMFRYDLDEMNSKFIGRLKKAKHIIIVGLGGSALPLKAFIDFFQLNDRVHFLDTVDPSRWHKLSKLKGAVFCIASKSGDTLEIKALLAEIISAKRLKDVLIVTDQTKGMLRTFAAEHKIVTLPIPAEIGGRFTNFSVFHQAVLEACGVKFAPLQKMARDYCSYLKRDYHILHRLYHQLFESKKSILILWAYGDRLLGFCQWAQQVIAESLGKRNAESKRFGITPIVLQGPQDQHSVLQLLSDGPQDKVLWFWESKFSTKATKRKLKAPLDIFSQVGLSESLSILCDSTFRTFEERLGNEETHQPVARFQITKVDDFIQSIVLIEALTEIAADVLKINAFDQPGVERGKEIARELIKTFS